MIVLIGNTKGGTGKSTTSVQLAVARANQGKNVWLVDGDPQNSSGQAITLRLMDGVKPAVAASHYPKGDDFYVQVEHQSKLYDDVILDCGGFDSESLRSALALADVLVVPFQPRAFDTWALSKMASLIDEAQRARSRAKIQPLRVHAMLSMADPGVNASDNLEAERVLEHYPQLPFLDASLGDRKAFAVASSRGLSVDELERKDQKASFELKRLVRHIFGDVE
ncbi:MULTISPECIES: AAA family ATPase [Pseudomonas]|jgi:chromosome partitioning protein|uniref:AAA family ATPase n=3 Tax=Pseudomonas TaxID=286 RepID=A0ABS0MZ30_PSELU|nr:MULTISPECIES: AAA family ATPase [Pseudomonas]MBH3441926.1 AAA family ATPase [Pseudomonas luteola]MCG7375227.1 AAA family ATPase [Pseudomonas luteola]MDN3238062.1 AAA family ATPase [Pseudomonas sp. WAC2]QEU31515.1 AAA family ATPase [Pseudomonas luteola]GGM32544.1 partition protein [Pseudomonas asuensis]